MRDPVVDEIKQRLSIVQIVQEYLPLKKAGANWRGLCPFHSEKSPSFMVSDDRMIFHCFGCNEGGDVFTFLQKLEGYDFPEVLKLLAERAGVAIAKRDPKIAHERNVIAEINDWASKFYQKVLLDSPSAEPARQYLASRALKPETIQRFGIGFAPEGWETLVTFLGKRGYRDEDTINAGLALRSSNGRGIYDRFRKRVMFTIRDAQGRVVGFTGRLLPEDEKKPDAGGKYVNTPESPLYHKGSVLFGLDQARHEIKKADLAVIVEGNMDVISSHQAGVSNVVASSGTALTDDQLRLLGRYSTNLAVSFDADSAGENAARRGIVTALRNGFIVRVITLPEGAGKDPDDCVRKNPELWKTAIANSVDIIDFLVARARAKFNLNTLEGKKQAIEQIVPVIAEVSDPVASAHYIKTLSESVGIPDDVIRGQIPNKSQAPTAVKTEAPRATGPEPITRSQMLGNRLLALYLRFGEVRPAIENRLKPEYLDDASLRDLYAWALLAYNDRNNPPPAPREDRVKALADILSLSLDVEPADEPLVETETILNNLASLHRQSARERLEAQMREAEKNGDFARIADIAKLFKEL